MDDCKKSKNTKKLEDKPKCNIFEFAQIIGNCQKIIDVK